MVFDNSAAYGRGGCKLPEQVENNRCSPVVSWKSHLANITPVNLCDMPSEISVLARLRLIDLSVAIEHNAPGEMTPPKIQYLDHAAGGPSPISLDAGLKI